MSRGCEETAPVEFSLNGSRNLSVCVSLAYVTLSNLITYPLLWRSVMSMSVVCRLAYLPIFTGPLFAIFSPHESVLHADDDLYLMFQFGKGRCHGNQIMLS